GGLRRAGVRWTVEGGAGGRYIAVGSLYGPGAGTGKLHSLEARYVFATRGSVNVIPVPNASELLAYSTAVAENDKLTLVSSPDAVLAARHSTTPAAVPEQPGDPSLIDHVGFIVRENRTY